jgi:leader peptidase (prepilin peptidase)/N-methyltransferase
VVEIVTAGLFAIVMVEFDRPIVAAAHCVFVAGLVAQTAIDLRTKRLPREITYTTIAVGAPLLAIAAIVVEEPRRLWTALVGAAIATIVMAALYAVSRGGLGDGDVRFAPLLGVYLGWSNPGLALVGLFFGFVVGAVVGVVMMIAGRAGRRTALPFGPFLAIGSMVALFIGQDFIDVVMVR